MTKHAPKPGDIDYDPSKDPDFLDKVDVAKDNKDLDNPPKATQLPAGPTYANNGQLAEKVFYGGTCYTADELVALYGTNPDGSPRTEAAPDGPNCPPVSPDDYPFDTTTIPSGCAAPLTAECAAYYNEKYAPGDASPTVFQPVGKNKPLK